MSARSVESVREPYDQLLNELTRLYAVKYNAFTRYAVSLTGSVSAAEDIVQEAFESAIKTLAAFEDRGVPLHGWVYKIIHHKAIDYQRKNGRLIPVEEVRSLDTSHDADPEEITIHKEMIELGLNAGYTVRQQKALLKNVVGYSGFEIAEHIGINPNVARIDIHYARKAARTALKEYMAA